MTLVVIPVLCITWQLTNLLNQLIHNCQSGSYLAELFLLISIIVCSCEMDL